MNICCVSRQDIVGAYSIEGYADQLLLMNEVSPNGLLAKGLFLYRSNNFVAARDFLNRGKSIFTCCQNRSPKINTKHCVLANSNSAFNTTCLKALGDTHLKLHAFTLAEYCYVTSKTESIYLARCLVEQRNPTKCEEALRITSVLHSTTDNAAKEELTELEAKYVS